MAVIGRGGYALAHGPRDLIRYLGASGIAASGALGIVLRKAGEPYPRIALGHIDNDTNIASSIQTMFSDIGYVAGEKAAVYLVGGLKLEESVVSRIARSLPYKKIGIFTDFGVTPQHKCVLDLDSGQIVSSKSCLRIRSYGAPDDAMGRSRQEPSILETNKPLNLEIDLSRGIPEKGLVLRPYAGDLFEKTDPTPYRFG